MKGETMNAKEISECIVDQIQNIDADFQGDVAEIVRKRFQRMIEEYATSREQETFNDGYDFGKVDNSCGINNKEAAFKDWKEATK